MPDPSRGPAVGLEPGVHDISLAEYIADPCPEPSLSASLGWTLLTRTALHAWADHPRLGAMRERAPSKEMDFGTVAHRLLLGKGAEINVVQADDYRTKAAREQRDAAYEDGKTPILEHVLDRAQAMMTAAHRQLAAHNIRDIFIRDGAPEQALIWKESNGIWCRACVDWLVMAGLGVGRRPILYDIKTTTSAHPNAWVNRVTQLGHAFKAAWYMRGAQMVFDSPDVRFRFITQETAPPYALAVYEIDPDDLIQAEQDVGAAIMMWGKCLESGSWPGYPPKVMQLPLPGYYRMARERAHDGGELSGAAIDQAISWARVQLEAK